MKHKVPLTIFASFALLSFGINVPVLANQAQVASGFSHSSVNASQGDIKRVTEPQGCWYAPGIGWIGCK